MKKNAKKTGSRPAKSKTTSHIAQKSLRAYRQTMREGQRLQEQATGDLRGALEHAVSMSDWQSAWARMAQMSGQLLPIAQNQVQNLMEVMQTSSQTGSELLKKTIDVAQAPLTPPNRKWLDLWTISLRAFQANTNALSQVASRNLSSWIKLMRLEIQRAT